MGHAVFILMHLAALIFALPALWLTVPLHVIYAVLKSVGKPRAGQAPVQHLGPGSAREGLRHCPECREVIRTDARRCKHCHAEVEPLVKPAQ